MGAVNKLNEYYDDDTIVVVNLSEEKMLFVSYLMKNFRDKVNMEV